jgi:hypothetical protein
MRSSRGEGGAGVVREKLEAEGGDGNCERLSMVSVGLSGWVGVVAWRSVPGVSNRDCTGSVFKVEPMERAPIQRILFWVWLSPS